MEDQYVKLQSATKLWFPIFLYYNQLHYLGHKILFSNTIIQYKIILAIILYHLNFTFFPWDCESLCWLLRIVLTGITTTINNQKYYFLWTTAYFYSYSTPLANPDHAKSGLWFASPAASFVNLNTACSVPLAYTALFVLFASVVPAAIAIDSIESRMANSLSSATVIAGKLRMS
jgi:hypothetical protein